MRLPKRSDSIYQEIENFEDYEYTNCIAYEMMIRNKDYSEKIKNAINEIYVLSLKLNYFEKIHYDYSANITKISDEELINSIESKNHTENQIKRKYLEINIDNESIEDLSFLVKLPFLTENQKYFLEDSIERLTIELNGGRGYANPIDIHEEEYTLEDYNQSLEWYLEEEYKSDFEIIRTQIDDEVYNGFRLSSRTWLKPLKNAYYDDYDRELTDMTAPPFLMLTGQYRHDKKIKPCFKRDIIPIEKQKEVNLNINFDLPLKEILAYVEHIKKEYDKDNSIIKSPLEMIGIESEKANDKAPSKRTIADKFFFYDYYKAVKHKSLADIDIWLKIDLEFLDYYESSKPDYYSNEYYKLTKREMINLIDNYGYEKLINRNLN